MNWLLTERPMSVDCINLNMNSHVFSCTGMYKYVFMLICLSVCACLRSLFFVKFYKTEDVFYTRYYLGSPEHFLKTNFKKYCVYILVKNVPVCFNL